MDSSSAPLASRELERRGGWVELVKGWGCITYEVLTQRIYAKHLKNPLPLPPLPDGFTCIVTGSTSGIGLEIARQLAVSGAHVVMAVRNQGAAHDLIQKWQAEEVTISQQLSVEVMELDLLSLNSVVRFADKWNSGSKALQVVINNAGICSVGDPQKFSRDGYETHMQVNHLGPALLSLLLLPSLMKARKSRIVNVSSSMHPMGHVDPEDMNFFLNSRDKFHYTKAYANSKLANVMFTTVLHNSLAAAAAASASDWMINTVCVSPGIVMTNVARGLSEMAKAVYRCVAVTHFSPGEGARSALYAATYGEKEMAEYWEVKKEWGVCGYISSDKPISQFCFTLYLASKPNLSRSFASPSTSGNQGPAGY